MKPLLLAAMFATAAAAAAPNEAEYAPTPPQQILTTDLSGNDLAFFAGAARQTALLTLLSDLAKTHATTPEVRAVAVSVSKEQTAFAVHLKDLANLKRIPLADEPDGAGKKQLETLGGLKGLRFDKSYVDALADAQDTLAASLFAGISSTDKDIKSYSTTALAILKQERDQVRKLGI